MTAVLLRGAGGKAFCAGGDVRGLYHGVKTAADPVAAAASYFAAEYRLDHQIHRFPKPLICLGDGIVMGGGMGLLVGASHRLVTERSQLAMPEITIGLFPDVGGTYFLPRLPRGLGLYLGLTATRLTAADALYCGLADHLIPLADVDALPQNLAALPLQPGETAANKKRLSAYFTSRTPMTLALASPLALHAEVIADCTAVSDVAGFVAKLTAAAAGDAWLEAGLTTLRTGSPSSAALIFHQYQLGKNFTLEEAFRWETSVAARCSCQADFAEGVRALLVDKDRNPRWQPPTLAAVDPGAILAICAPLWPAASHPLRDLATRAAGSAN